MQRVNLSPFPHSLSIFSQPGCQAATSCATLILTQTIIKQFNIEWCHAVAPKCSQQLMPDLTLTMEIYPVVASHAV